jgi:hypothetical protein
LSMNYRGQQKRCKGSFQKLAEHRFTPIETASITMSFEGGSRGIPSNVVSLSRVPAAAK